MRDALTSVLPSAIGMALSPVPIVAMILALFSARARINSVIFLLGVLIPTLALPFLWASAYSAVEGEDAGTIQTARWVLTTVALLLLFAAYRNWTRRSNHEVPAMLTKIEGMGPGAVLMLSLGATVFNPKNMAMLLSAGQSLGAADLTAGELVFGVVVFALVASSPYLAAVAFKLFGGKGASESLDRAKEWLVSRNRLIMAIVLGVFGLVLLTKGLSAAQPSADPFGGVQEGYEIARR